MKTEEQYFDRADVKAFWAFRKYLRDSSLSTSARLLAVDVWFHMQIGKLRANPSLATLVENTGMSERTVRRGMSEIKACGFFKVTGGRGQRQTYKFEMIAPQKTLFELSEMLAEKPKPPRGKAAKLAANDAVKAAKLTAYDTAKAANLSTKAANLAPEYNLEYKLTDDDAREASSEKFADGELRSRLIAAAGHAIVNPAESSHLGSMARPHAWLDAGCDLERDILPTVRRVSAKCSAGAVRSWQFFEAEIMAEKARRERVPGAAVSGDNVRPLAPGSIRARQAEAWAALESLKRKRDERERQEAACA